MTAFENVMKNWKRMCEAHTFCDICPLYGLYIKCPRDIVMNKDVDFAQAERLINKWVQEHPEDTRPTVGEWLIRNRMSIFDPIPDALLNIDEHANKP